MVIDSNLIGQDTFKEIVSLYERFKNIYQYSEESTLNLYFYKNWNILPSIYNSIPGYINKIYGIEKNKVLAIIYHFVCDTIKPWEQGNPYYQEWFENFKKAEKIDLAKRPEVINIFSKQRLFWYRLYLNFRRFVYPITFAHKLYLYSDKQIGCIGIYLKKNNPKLYRRLLRIKKNVC